MVCIRNKQLRTNYLYEYTHELDLLYQQLFRALIGGGGGVYSVRLICVCSARLISSYIILTLEKN